MNLATHLLVGWEIGCRATTVPRDRSLIVCASLAPDLDGLGILVDGGTRLLGCPPTHVYAAFHHSLLHGVVGALIVSAGILACAEQRARTAAFGLLAFHIHLVCDLVGSGGSAPGDIWPIHYLAPFSDRLTFSWAGQWPLNSWVNIALTAALLALAIRRSAREGVSPFVLVSERANEAFVALVRRCAGRWQQHP
jgi:inner membrane protein